MTEQTLNRALQIKKELDSARNEQGNIKAKMNLCIGNFSEVASRKFELRIKDGTGIKDIAISSNSAYEILKIDYLNLENVIKDIETELDQLY